MEKSFYEELITICIALTSENDGWAISAEGRMSSKPETVVVAVSPASRVTWLERKLSMIRKLVEDFDEKKMTGKKDGVSVYFMILDAEQQLGVIEALFSMNALKRKDIITALGDKRMPDTGWPIYGYHFERGIISLNQKDGAKSSPLVIPSAVEFWELLSFHPDHKQFAKQKMEEQRKWNDLAL